MNSNTIIRGSFRSIFAPAAMVALAAMSCGTGHAQTPAGGSLDEIIVTAQRRAEALQDVPISISTATAAQLDRAVVTNVRDLPAVIPGLMTSGQGANMIPSIRGVSSAQTDPGNDANVSLYVDGVYQPDELANNMDFPDISRIEVLKGPQGTLFGRNATGGAIRIFTEEPSLTVPSGHFDVGYGNYSHFAVKGFVSEPLIAGKLAASVSASYETEDSYTFNIVTNHKSSSTVGKSARVKLLAAPMDGLSIEVFGSYVNRTCGDCTAYSILNGNTFARLIPGAIFPTRMNTYASNSVPTVDAQVDTAGLRASFDTGVGELSSTTAYNKSSSYYFQDEDGSTALLLQYPIYKKQYTWSEELIFSSNKFDQFQFIAGAFYYGDTARYDPLVLQGPAFGGQIDGYSMQRTKAYAGFGELTYTPTDRLTFLAGARYSHEKRDAQGAYGLPGPRPAVLPALGQPVDFNSVTPRASVRYRLTEEDDNVYFTYSQGFKSGGFNISGLQPTPFQPEKLKAYEVGIKTAPSRILSVNAAAFYYDYTDQQVMAAVNNFNFTANAASSRIYGADFDIMARLTPEFTVTSGIELLDAKYRKYRNAVGNLPIFNPDGSPCLCGNNTVTNLDLSGGQEPFSPKFTMSLGVDYKKQVTAGQFDFTATGYYSSKYSLQSQTLIQNPSYTTLALSASFEPANSNFTVYLWGKNVTSARYFVAELTDNASDQVVYARPGSYGGGFKYKF